MRRICLLFTVFMLPVLADAQAVEEPTELLNEEERQWLASLREPIIVGAEAGYGPYSFLDEDGELDGVAGDYLRLIEERLGIRFAVHEYPSFADTLAAARNRHIDVVPFVIAAPERREYLDFTQPFFVTRDRILTTTASADTLTLDDLKGREVGLVEGYALQAQLAQSHPDIRILPMPNELAGLRALSLGELEIFIADVGVTSYYIRQEAITNIRVAGEVQSDGLQTFGTRNDWPILGSIIGKALANIPEQEHDDIQGRWINIGGIDPQELERLWQWVAVVVGVIALAVVAILFWNLSLRKLVTGRTLELQRELGERRRVEAAKERLAVAVEQSAEYVLVVDSAGNIEYANLSFLEAHGVNRLDGRRLPSLATGEARGTLVQALKDAHAAGVWRGRVNLERARKGPMTVSMTITPIHTDDGGVDGHVVTARDVTNEEQLEGRLRQREKLSALGTLANGIAHDFNNLLVPILGYTDLIRMQSDSAVRSYLDSITEASERARDLVQRILIFGRGGQGEKVPVDLRFEVEDAINFVRSLLPPNIELQSELQACRTIMAERTQLQQILLNLCTNAGDAMADEGGLLTIRVGEYELRDGDTAAVADLLPGKYALLSVSDTGIGMDEKTMARVFDPYYSDKRRGKGTGLGLAIVHGIVRGHGGVIHVDSAPGDGTEINIYFPTVEAEPSRDPADSDQAMPRGSGERIMVIDDDRLVLSTVTVMVQGLGYEVSEWTNPVLALDALGETPDSVDAILTDLTMSELSGIELAKRALEIREDIPVAIMTGNPGALEGYAIRCVKKPIPLSELADCLQQILR